MKQILAILLIVFTFSCHRDDNVVEPTDDDNPILTDDNPIGSDFDFILEETPLPDFNERACNPELGDDQLAYDSIIRPPYIKDLCFVRGNDALVCYVESFNLSDSLYVLDRSTGEKKFLFERASVYNLDAAKNTLAFEANGGELRTVDLETGMVSYIPNRGWHPRVSPSGNLLHYETSQDSGQSTNYFQNIARVDETLLREVKDEYGLDGWTDSDESIYAFDYTSGILNLIEFNVDAYKHKTLHSNIDDNTRSFYNYGKNYDYWLSYYAYAYYSFDVIENVSSLLVKSCKTQTFRLISYDPMCGRIFFCLDHLSLSEDKRIRFVEQHWYSVNEEGSDFREVKLNL